ncbi:MAG: stage III sporulation protein AF, partial [Clostridium butyricum]
MCWGLYGSHNIMCAYSKPYVLYFNCNYGSGWQLCSRGLIILEKLKALVATLTTVLIFISAVEILAPDKKMKKYISFVLGLILISTILNPIVEFIT